MVGPSLSVNRNLEKVFREYIEQVQQEETEDLKKAKKKHRKHMAKLKKAASKVEKKLESNLTIKPTMSEEEEE